MLKNALYVAIIIVFVTSCKNKPDKAPIQSRSADTLQQHINKLKPILQGIWIKQDYIEKIIAKRSPLQAADKALGITTLKIDSATIAFDSLKAAVTYNNQQPSEVVLKFKPGKNKAAMPFGENELGYSIKNRDTTLVLYQYYQNKWVLALYKKSLQRLSGNNLQEGITHLINKDLFAGKYILIDSLGKTNTITFKDDGKIIGFGKFDHYFVENAFAEKAMNNLDQITFNIFSSNEKTFAFKIDDNTLSLFEIKNNTKAALLVQGRLKYRLVKLKAK